jgi:hypothetical protein
VLIENPSDINTIIGAIYCNANEGVSSPAAILPQAFL